MIAWSILVRSCRWGHSNAYQLSSKKQRYVLWISLCTSSYRAVLILMSVLVKRNIHDESNSSRNKPSPCDAGALDIQWWTFCSAMRWSYWRRRSWICISFSCDLSCNSSWVLKANEPKEGGEADSRTLQPFFSSFPLAGKEGFWPDTDGTSVLLERIHIWPIYFLWISFAREMAMKTYPYLHRFTVNTSTGPWKAMNKISVYQSHDVRLRTYIFFPADLLLVARLNVCGSSVSMLSLSNLEMRNLGEYWVFIRDYTNATLLEESQEPWVNRKQTNQFTPFKPSTGGLISRAWSRLLVDVQGACCSTVFDGMPEGQQMVQKRVGYAANQLNVSILWDPESEGINKISPTDVRGN